MAGGSDGDFQDAYVELFVRAERVAMRILQSRSDAEDVAAETMVKAMGSWMRIRRYRLPWVTKVAANLAVDELRRRQRTIGGPDVPSVPPDLTDRIVIVSMLGRLPFRQRQAIVLHHLVGLTVTETATVMGVSTGSVKTHLQRAAQDLPVLGQSSQHLAPDVVLIHIQRHGHRVARPSGTFAVYWQLNWA